MESYLKPQKAEKVCETKSKNKEQGNRQKSNKLVYIIKNIKNYYIKITISNYYIKNYLNINGLNIAIKR